MGEVTQKFVKGEVIIAEGSRGDRTYRILSGEVLICKETGGQDYVPIAKLGPGEMFGEMYLLDHSGLRSASAIAVSDVEVDIIFQEEMAVSLQPLTSNLKQILEGLSRRLKNTSSNYALQLSHKKYTFRKEFMRDG